MKYKIIMYEDENSKIPVREFMYELEPKMRMKLAGLLEILQDNGPSMREPYSKHICDGIFELRCKFGSNITRVLYFFSHEGNIILTNGFIKKTVKTPKREIETAKIRRQKYIERVK